MFIVSSNAKGFFGRKVFGKVFSAAAKNPCRACRRAFGPGCIKQENWLKRAYYRKAVEPFAVRACYNPLKSRGFTRPLVKKEKDSCVKTTYFLAPNI